MTTSDKDKLAEIGRLTVVCWEARSMDEWALAADRCNLLIRKLPRRLKDQIIRDAKKRKAK